MEWTQSANSCACCCTKVGIWIWPSARISPLSCGVALFNPNQLSTARLAGGVAGRGDAAAGAVSKSSLGGFFLAAGFSPSSLDLAFFAGIFMSPSSLAAGCLLVPLFVSGLSLDVVGFFLLTLGLSLGARIAGLFLSAPHLVGFFFATGFLSASAWSRWHSLRCWSKLLRSVLWTGACNCYQHQSHCEVIAVHRHPKFHLAILWGFNEVKASICMSFTTMKINHDKKENWACLSLPCVMLVTVKKMEMLTALDNFERHAACS